MKKKTNNYPDCATAIENFFTKYLILERGASNHTVRAYSDAFVRLLDFFTEVKNIKAEKLSLQDITKNATTDFLAWLEESGNSVSTRNQRCAAIKSFAKYLIYIDPVHMEQWKGISSIKPKKDKKENISYLTIEGITKLLESIDLSTPRGRRDYTILSLLYYIGARAQELVDLTPSSFRLSEPYLVQVMGKGSKKRSIPLDETLVSLVKAYMKEHQLNRPERSEHPLFYNVWHEKLTTAGLAYIIDKYVKPAHTIYPDLIPESVSPHAFRHSRAMHLLQAGVNMVIIRDYLGHVHLQTTEIYARVDSKQKREALAKAYNPIGKEEPKENSWDNNPKLKAFLKSLA